MILGAILGLHKTGRYLHLLATTAPFGLIFTSLRRNDVLYGSSRSVALCSTGYAQSSGCMGWMSGTSFHQVWLWINCVQVKISTSSFRSLGPDRLPRFCIMHNPASAYTRLRPGCRTGIMRHNWRSCLLRTTWSARQATCSPQLTSSISSCHCWRRLFIIGLQNVVQLGMSSGVYGQKIWITGASASCLDEYRERKWGEKSNLKPSFPYAMLNIYLLGKCLEPKHDWYLKWTSISS